MAEDLHGAAALVTGASSGIGRATALRLAAAGAAVTVVARRRDRLDELVARIHGAGGQALAVASDITDVTEAGGAVASAVARFGRLDIVVNAAGVMLNGPTLDIPLEYWDEMVDLNLKGLMYVTKTALSHLIAAVDDGDREVADVVNISSISGRQTDPTTALYNATKFGVTAATDSWRKEFARRGIRFSVIEPGYTDTELFSQQGPEQEARYARNAADVRKLHPEDVADAVMYIVGQPRRVAINEIVVRPTDQA
jgi:NADP-dependent 3-hydroxy acid dehydrogenase YdfG